MKKTINLLSIIVVLGILALFPIAIAEATWTYVGIQVDSAKRIYDNSNFCLLPNTTMDVMSGATSLNTVTTADSTCSTGTGNTTLVPGTPTGTAGKQIWSNLINLTSGSQYALKLTVPLCFGYWHRNTGINNPYYCWYKGTQNGGGGFNETCNQICTDNGTTPVDSNACGRHYDENCLATKALFSGLTSCSPCNQNNYGYSGRDTGNVSCWSNNNWNAYNGCDWSSSSYSFVCVCNYNTGTYSFPFTFTVP